MAAQGFIVGYVCLWMAWKSIVAECAPRRPLALEMARCLAIGACIVAPIVGLAVVAHCTTWIPPRVNEMLTLMTPVLAAVFAADHIEVGTGRTGVPNA
jgi:hypothetical protein